MAESHFRLGGVSEIRESEAAGKGAPASRQVDAGKFSPEDHTGPGLQARISSIYTSALE